MWVSGPSRCKNSSSRTVRRSNRDMRRWYRRGAAVPRDNAGLARLIRRDLGEGRISKAFAEVDRAGFVPPGSGDVYRDRPVPIPEHQTTSQPSLIARMIDAIDPGPDDRVLEVG